MQQLAMLSEGLAVAGAESLHSLCGGDLSAATTTAGDSLAKSYTRPVDVVANLAHAQ